MLWPAIWLLLPVVTLTSLVLAGSLARAERVGGAGRALALADSAVLALSSAFLVVYVAGEDDYRGTGITRWEAYDVKLLTGVAVAVGGIAAIGRELAARLPLDGDAERPGHGVGARVFGRARHPRATEFEAATRARRTSDAQ